MKKTYYLTAKEKLSILQISSKNHNKESFLMSSDNIKSNLSSQAASEMGKKGGAARAAALTPERRKEISAKALASRKCCQKYPKAVNEGILLIGDHKLPCAVLEDGTRVLTQRALVTVMGARKGGGTKKAEGGALLPPFLAYSSLKPVITKKLEASSCPIKFKMKKGGIANGYKAELLADVCEIYLKARDLDLLPHNQLHIAAQCEIIMRALAKVGITGLVDEASGYQQDRERDALQKLLAEYISEELLPWTRRFPIRFFDELKRIYNCKDLKGTPAYFGHFINKYIYKPLAPGVLEELKEKNPTNDNGRRKDCHHQWLTETTGVTALDKQLIEITTLMKISERKDTFETNFKKCFKSKGE